MFTSITEGPMLDDAGPFENSFWTDYDNDGFLDLFLTGGFETNPSASGYKNAVYRNRGNGTFERIADAAILSATTHAGSQTWGDYDNDGFVDVFIAQWGGRGGVLMRNEGNGVFTRVPPNPSANFGTGPLAVWGDFNRDGFLDLAMEASGRNVLRGGSAGGAFAAFGALDALGGWNRSAADYDNDGWLDLIVNTAPQGSLVLYKNNGEGGLARVTSGDIPNQGPGFWGVAWGDYDNDGLLDLCAVRGPLANNVLFQNQGNGRLAQVRNIGAIGSTAFWNPDWVDFDNDGYLDLYLAGGPGAPAGLFRNNGDGTFQKMEAGAIVTDRNANSYGPSWGDFDHNGFLDLFVPNQDGPHRFYRNNGNPNAWIQFVLVGTASNRAGIGAKVRVRTKSNGKDLWQLREIMATDGYDGPGTLRAEFGLGDATRVEVVRVEWPSGVIQEFHDIAPRQILTVTEPLQLTEAQRTGEGSAKFTLIGAAGVPAKIEYSTDLRSWNSLMTITNRARKEAITDMTANTAVRYYRASGPAPAAFPR